MTPEKVYDPVKAFSILENYPEACINSAVQQLRDQGTLVKGKKNHERRLPGRVIQLSERFLYMFAGCLPLRLFADANLYHQQLQQKVLTARTSEPMEFSPLVENGNMAALINLFFTGKVSSV
jgi:hypothetical protein